LRRQHHVVVRVLRAVLVDVHGRDGHRQQHPCEGCLCCGALSAFAMLFFCARVPKMRDALPRWRNKAPKENREGARGARQGAR
jgi:hypothetical protein